MQDAESDPLRLSEAECSDLLDELFPDDLAAPDVLLELAPLGWEGSPLLAVFHPTAEVLHDESTRILRNLRSMFPPKADATDDEPSEPTLEQIRAERRPTPIEPQREARELVAMCLWDIFSNNHEVIAPDGRIADLGSFRGSAAFLAEWVNRASGRDAAREHDYMDFYMGTTMVSGRAEFDDVYRMIFRRLAAHGCDWRYEFPRLNLIDLGPPGESQNEPEHYDPEAALLAERAREGRHAKLEELRRSIDEARQEAVAQARDAGPPSVVRAYRAAFCQLPDGWPPG